MGIKNPGGMALSDMQADMNAKRYELAKEKVDVLLKSWQRFSSGPDSCSGAGISDIVVTFRQMPGGINASNVELDGKGVRPCIVVYWNRQMVWL